MKMDTSYFIAHLIERDKQKAQKLQIRVDPQPLNESFIVSEAPSVFLVGKDWLVAR